MAYPTTLDSLATNKVDGTATLTDHKDHHNALATAVNAIETELGLLPKGGSATVRARLDVIQPPSPSAYTVTNTSADRAIDANSTTLAELLNVVGTLITDLKARGVIG